MVNRFKSSNIYSSYNSFFPFLPPLSIHWLFCTFFLILPMNHFNPHHSLFACTFAFPSPVFSSPSLFFFLLFFLLFISFLFPLHSCLSLIFFSVFHTYTCSSFFPHFTVFFLWSHFSFSLLIVCLAQFPVCSACLEDSLVKRFKEKMAPIRMVLHVMVAICSFNDVFSIFFRS